MTRTAPVTVIVPAFNAAPFLGVTLEALQSQTTAPEQIIVVDDGSTDGTAALAEQMGVRVIKQDQKGPGAARNRGIEAADTEFVAFCDADDWYVPDKLERALDMLERLGASCTATDAWVVRDDRVQGRKNEQRPVPGVLTFEFLLRGNPIVCSSVVARRDAVINAGAFDEAPELIATEDYDLWLRMAVKEPIAYASRPMTFYRVHAASLSANTGFLRGVEHILSRISEQHKGEAHFQNLIKCRRADVRLDLAWDLMSEGDHVQARQLIKEAQKMASTWKGFKMQLRSLLKR
ncbi:MAG: glycosyltransferase involved in cell wall biosynthesis [Planctomycetota bacterium]|jgi:glycosyltransferase involved in cell wall biosynthesis